MLGGLHEQYVTIAAQQTRAFNLAWALKSHGGFPPDRAPAIAVVGAGAGGATFAVAAQQWGAEVTVFDEHEEPISAQRWSRDRHLHPHLLAWPSPGWDREDAGLPTMNWSAGPAADVRLGLVREFASHAAGSSDSPDEATIAWYPQHIVWELSESNDAVKVLVSPIEDLAKPNAGHPTPAAEPAFDLVVVATGFLPERRGPGVTGSRSYWRDGMRSPTAHTQPAGGSPARTVVGMGDGAFIDLLLMALEGGQHERFVHGELVEHARALAADRELVQAVLEIEREAAEDPSVDTISRFREIWRTREREHPALTGGAPITLIGQRPPSNLHGCTLHRLLTALAIEKNRVRLIQRPGPVDGSQIPSSDPLLTWRAGPRRRSIAQLARPVFSPRDAVDAAGGEARGLPPGVLTDLVDISRMPLWSDEDFTSSGVAPAERWPVLEQSRLESSTSVGPLWSRLDAVDAAHLADTCRDLATVAAKIRALTPTRSGYDNFAVSDLDVTLSLDAVACVAELTPTEVVVALLGGPDAGIALTPFAASRGASRVGRTWVRVTKSSCSSVDVSDPRLWELMSVLIAPPSTPNEVLFPRDPGSSDDEHDDPSWSQGSADRPARWLPVTSVTVGGLESGVDPHAAEVLRSVASIWNAARDETGVRGNDGPDLDLIRLTLEDAEQEANSLVQLALERIHRNLSQDGSWRSLVHLAALAASEQEAVQRAAMAFVAANGLVDGSAVEDRERVLSALIAAATAQAEDQAPLVSDLLAVYGVPTDVPTESAPASLATFSTLSRRPRP